MSYVRNKDTTYSSLHFTLYRTFNTYLCICVQPFCTDTEIKYQR